MIVVALIVLALAGVSLLLPWAPVYDPWGWLVWGREVAALELDTSSGPSWKPLPVVFTTVFSTIPGIAPELWLFVARAGWLAAVALAALLAARLAARAGGGSRERVAAAAVAGLGLILLGDGFTPWLRQFAGGLSEPLLTALVLAAVERWLAGRAGAALALAGAAALIRPEVWPFLALYVAWLGRSRKDPELGRAGLAVIAGVAVLWTVPDLLGSGSVLTGADRAREGTGSPPVEALEVLLRAAILPLAVFWVGFAVGLADARRQRDRAVVVIAAAALAWIGLVAVMAAGGYAGLPRFVAPAVAVVCALGASGLVSFATSALDRRSGARLGGTAAAAAAVAVAFVLQAGFRAVELGEDASSATELGAAHEDLRRLVAADGAHPPRGCRPVAVDAIEGQTPLAWRLDLPIEAIEVSRPVPARGLYLERGDDGWEAVELGCPNDS